MRKNSYKTVLSHTRRTEGGNFLLGTRRGKVSRFMVDVPLSSIKAGTGFNRARHREKARLDRLAETGRLRLSLLYYNIEPLDSWNFLWLLREHKDSKG